MSLRIMKDPVAYVKHNKKQQRDNHDFLLDNIKKINWKGDDRIVDIGSGDGSCTSKILNGFLPDDYQELVGVDRSEDMVRYANQNHSNEKVSFRVFELGKALDKNLVGRFDHAFSFFTLQLVHDHKKAFRQIHDMLSPNGDCLLSMICESSPYYDMYDHFCRSQKWGIYFKEVDIFYSPYHNCPNVEETAKKNMLHAGFKEVHVQNVQKSFKYESIEDFKLAIRAINSFPIPEEVFEEYLDDHINGALEKGFINKDLSFRYNLVFIYGRK